MDKKFTYYENILSEGLINELHDYYYGNILDLSREKYGEGFVEKFLNSEAPKVLPSSVNITQDHQLRILDELYHNENLPFFGNKKILRGSIGLPMRINNFLPGGGFPPHTDNAWGSMTLFLNKEWKPEWGGSFVWYEDDDTEQERGHEVQPKYNCGILDCYPETVEGCLHRVMEVTRERITIQAFFGLGGHYVNIGKIPDKYKYLIPKSLGSIQNTLDKESKR
tara:strand:- start:15252 stop:15920 length:669 start_codon:yes stop_codon:yes gene_type:complete